jgi:hypothetical protein
MRTKDIASYNIHNSVTGLNLPQALHYRRSPSACMRSPLLDAKRTNLMLPGRRRLVPLKLLALDSYDLHGSSGACPWVETALRVCPALYAGVG